MPLKFYSFFHVRLLSNSGGTMEGVGGRILAKKPFIGKHVTYRCYLENESLS